MYRRAHLIFVLAMLLPALGMAQQLTVTEPLHKDPTRTDAARLLVKDLNEKPCGLLRLGLVLENATFEGDIMRQEYRNGEWYIWMIPGADWITILSPEYQPLHYDFPESIESSATYLMMVSKPKKTETVYVEVPVDRPVYPPRKKFNWETDFRCIAGLNNGILGSEIFGLYGEVGLGEHYGAGIIGSIGFPDRGSIGLKCYLQSISLSAHYGTLMNIYGDTEEEDDPFQIDDDGTFHNPNSLSSSIYGKYGFSALIGYDHRFGWLHLMAGIGFSIPQADPSNVLFAWNVGLGISLVDLLK